MPKLKSCLCSSCPVSLFVPAVLARVRSAALRSFQALRSRGLCSPGSLMPPCQSIARQCYSHSNISRALRAFSLSAAPTVAWPQDCLSGLALIYGRGGIQIGVRLWYLGPLALTTGMSCICSTRFYHEACCDSGLPAVTEIFAVMTWLSALHNHRIRSIDLAGVNKGYGT